MDWACCYGENWNGPNAGNRGVTKILAW